MLQAMRTLFCFVALSVASCTPAFDPSNVKAPAVLIVQDDEGKPFECVNIEGDDVLIVRPRRLGDTQLTDVLATVDCKSIEVTDDE